MVAATKPPMPSARSLHLAKPRVAIYCRVSSAGQEDNSSLGTQEERCRAYATERGWAVSTVYREVHSGAELFERPQLSLLRESMRRKEFDVLLVYALDRLSRKQTHQGLILSEAEHAGVEWDSVTEDIDDSPQGQILRAVIGGMAEMERLKIAERTMRGRLARVHAGKLMPGSKPPYGYRWRGECKSALDLDPVTAPIIRRIFERIASGDTMHAIVRDLRARNVPTPTGRGMWHVATLRVIVAKPHYYGKAYAWGWRRRTPDNPQQFDPNKAIALPEGTVPPIVDESTWCAVQERLALNQRRAIRNARNPESALLRGGYVRCGVCGRVMSAREHAARPPEYICARGPKAGQCPGCSIVAHRVDTDVWARVEALLTQPDIVRREVARLRTTDPTTRELTMVATAMADLERQQANLARAIAQIDDPYAAAPLTAQLGSLRAQHLQLEAERQGLLARRNAWAVDQHALDHVTDWCQRVASNLTSLSWAEKRLVLDALGVGVVVNPYGQTPRYMITAEIPLDVVSRTT
jgi:site-specific DNA recombinase